MLPCAPPNKYNTRHWRSQKGRDINRNAYSPRVIYPCISSDWQSPYPDERRYGEEKYLSPHDLWSHRDFRSASLYNPSWGNDRSLGSAGDYILSGDCSDKNIHATSGSFEWFYMLSSCLILYSLCFEEPLNPFVSNLWITFCSSKNPKDTKVKATSQQKSLLPKLTVSVNFFPWTKKNHLAEGMHFK